MTEEKQQKKLFHRFQSEVLVMDRAASSESFSPSPASEHGWVSVLAADQRMMTKLVSLCYEFCFIFIELQTATFTNRLKIKVNPVLKCRKSRIEQKGRSVTKSRVFVQ